MSNIRRPIVVLGSGGHARVLVDALRLQGENIIGFVAPSVDGGDLGPVAWIGNDLAISQYAPDDVLLVNGVGSTAQPGLRRDLFMTFKRMGYGFASVIHPSSVVAQDVALGEGTQIMAGAVVQCRVRIGDNALINTRASVDHDCCIADHVHVAPGSTLCGGVEVGSGVHIGAGSTIIQGVRVGEGAVIGAGALVLTDVEPGVTIVGVPAGKVSK